MVTKAGLSTYSIGTYSEMIAAAAFIASGCEVAFPISNAKAWDLVVRWPEGQWQSVQVKTAHLKKDGKYPAVSLKKQKEGMVSVGVDLLIAVDPTTGILWKIPVGDRGCRWGTKLGKEYLWRGAIEPEALPMSPEGKPMMVAGGLTPAEERARIAASLPTERPEWASIETWGMVMRWAGGETCDVISKSAGSSSVAVYERIMRVFWRLGLVDPPAAYVRKTRGAPKGYKWGERMLEARTGRREKLAQERAMYREKLPQDKPASMLQATWEAVVRWCNGEGYKVIAGSQGTGIASAKDRIQRAIGSLKLDAHGVGSIRVENRAAPQPIVTGGWAYNLDAEE